MDEGWRPELRALGRASGRVWRWARQYDMRILRTEEHSHWLARVCGPAPLTCPGHSNLVKHSHWSKLPRNSHVYVWASRRARQQSRVGRRVGLRTTRAQYTQHKHSCVELSQQQPPFDLGASRRARTQPLGGPGVVRWRVGEPDNNTPHTTVISKLSPQHHDSVVYQSAGEKQLLVAPGCRLACAGQNRVTTGNHALVRSCRHTIALRVVL